jgi:hypothetical protein
LRFDVAGLTYEVAAVIWQPPISNAKTESFTTPISTARITVWKSGPSTALLSSMDARRSRWGVSPFRFAEAARNKNSA